MAYVTAAARRLTWSLFWHAGAALLVTLSAFVAVSAAEDASAETAATPCANLVGTTFAGATVTAATTNTSGTFVPPPLAQTGQAHAHHGAS